MVKQEAVGKFMEENGFYHVARQEQENIEMAFCAGYDAGFESEVKMMDPYPGTEADPQLKPGVEVAGFEIVDEPIPGGVVLDTHELEEVADEPEAHEVADEPEAHEVAGTMDEEA